MRIMICSTGVPLSLSYHLNGEGHTVNTSYTVGSLITTNLPDLSIFDAVSDPSVAASLRTKGVKVLGVDSWARLLETEPSYKHAVMRSLGYELPPPDAKGDRVIVSCFFNGNKFISHIIIFPYTRMMSSDVGIDTECSGYIALCHSEGSKLVKSITEPLEKFLRKASHRGHFSVDCLVDKEHIYVTDVSASLSKAYITGIFENSRLSKTDILLKMFDENSSPLHLVDPFVCGILVSIAPFPFLVPKQPEKVEGLNPMNLKHLWLIDVAQSGENWICGSNSGCLGYVTARGTSIQESQRRAYRTLQRITIPNIQFRGDIGRDVYERHSRLKLYGHIN